MKRIFGFLIIGLGALLLLTACQRSNASRANIDIARQALAIADELLDRNISPEAAHARASRLSSISTTSTGNQREDDANRALRTYVSRLTSALQANTFLHNAENRRAVVDARNDIARELGMRTRRT